MSRPWAVPGQNVVKHTDPALDAAERPLILKALITYLVSREPSAAEVIKQRVTEDAYRNFIRLNARPDALRGAYQKLVEGVQAYLLDLTERGERLPESVLPLVEAVAPQKVSDKRVPYYLSPAKIRAEMNKFGGDDEFLRVFAGVYRVFRLTSDSGAAGQLNRGFLNIKPRKVLNAIQQETPCFTCVFRDGAGQHSDEQRPSIGLVFPYGRRVLFLGSQLAPGQSRFSRQDGDAVTMEWKLPIEPGPVTRAVGVYMGPNAAGQLVASVLFAYRIPESEAYPTTELYEAERAREIAAVGRYNPDDPKDRDALIADMGEAEFDDLLKRARDPKGSVIVKV